MSDDRPRGQQAGSMGAKSPRAGSIGTNDSSRRVLFAPPYSAATSAEAAAAAAADPPPPTAVVVGRVATTYSG